MNEHPDDIRRRIHASRASLASQIKDLGSDVEAQFGETASHVSAAAETITGTVHAVQDGLEHARQRVDVRGHVERHPWAMTLGAVAVGYVGTRIIQGRSDDGPQADYTRRDLVPVSRPRDVTPEKAKGNGSGDEESFTHWVGAKMGGVLRDEFQTVKGLALGALIGVIRDLASNAAPSQMGSPIEQSFDRLTRHWGGEPVDRQPRTKRQPTPANDTADDGAGAMSKADTSDTPVDVARVGDL